MSIVTFPARGLNKMVASEADKLRNAFAEGAAEPEAPAFGTPAPEDDDLETVIEARAPRSTGPDAGSEPR